MKLTKRFIDGLASGKSRYYKWDELRGFGIAVHPSGYKSFILKYRTLTGRQNMLSIGRFGELTLDQARRLAQEKLHEVRGGKDPAAERQKQRKGTTVADICKTFLEEHAALKKPRTVEMYTWCVNAEIIPAFGSKRVEAVTETNISRLIHRIGKTHKHKANRVRATLSKMFDLAERWGFRERGTNPVTYVAKYKEKSRHRDLKPQELKALAEALVSIEDETENRAGIEVIRLLLFTGMRRGEALNLRWSEIDLDRAMIHLGDSKTGKKTVYLNSAARQILGIMDRFVGCPFVFPAQYRPKGRGWKPMPEWELRRVWETVKKKAGLCADGDVEAFRLHDLRHSFASLGAGEGLSLPQIGELLGHSQSRTTERYADLVNISQMDSAEKIGRIITQGMNSESEPKPKPKSEVVSIKKKLQ